MELRARRKDGSEFPVDISLAHCEVKGERLMLCVVRDMTEQRAAEHALQKARDDLRQVQKMDALGRLAGGIAHDFNNVLAVILTRTSMLLDVAGPELHEDLQQIQAAGVHARTVVAQLLAFGRKQIVTPKVIEPNAVIERFAMMLRHTLGDDITLTLALSPDVPRIALDPGQLEQVLLNLVLNARDAMPEGGTLRIATAAGAGCLELLVSDTGRGMAPETQQRAFEPFFTTKDHGTGLGLATVHGIVEQTGGTITFLSEHGNGTRFRIVIPAVIGDATPRPPEPIMQPNSTGTILVLDDDDAVRGTLERMLARAGYRVLSARDVATALALCDTHEGPIDLLLTDIVLPQSNGLRAAEAIVARRPATRVLYMSGYTDHPELREGVEREHIDFIAKPFASNELRSKIHELLAS